MISSNERVRQMVMLVLCLATLAACDSESPEDKTSASTGDSSSDVGRSDAAGSGAAGSISRPRSEAAPDTTTTGSAGTAVAVAGRSAQSDAGRAGGNAGSTGATDCEQSPCGCGQTCPDASTDDAGTPNDSEPVCDGETVHSTCGFEFCAPESIREMSGAGDSCLNLYEANGCSYLGDYGRYSSPLDEGTAESNYKEEFATIDGLNAVLVSYGPTTTQSRPYFAGVHFAAVPKGTDQRFTFVAQCNTTEGQSASLELFHTLRFDR